MSDDRGNAESEAGLADPDRRLERVQEVVAALGERLAEMNAGLREDLMQVRAIASSLADRDLTEEVASVRRTVEDLAGRDFDGAVREDLQALRELVVDIQSSDPAGQVRSELDPIRLGLDRIADRLADDSAHQRLLERLAELEGRLESLAAADRSEEVLGRFEQLPTREQVRGLAADLRAHVADALGGLDGDAISANVQHVRETIDAEARSVASAIEVLQETMLDAASGEVVGALWDEFRALRDSLDQLSTSDGGAVEVEELLEALRTELQSFRTTLQPDDEAARRAAEAADAAASGVARTSADLHAIGVDLGSALSEIRALSQAVDRLAAAPPAPVPTPERETEPTGPDPAVLALQEHVQALTAEVRELLEAAEVEPVEGEEADAGARREAAEETSRLFQTLSDDLASLRTELHEGLVVEPSDDLTGTLEALRVEMDGLQSGLAALPGMQSALENLQEAIAGLDTAAAPAPPDEATTAPSEELRGELERILAAVEGVQERLDEGLVLADDVELPPAEDEADRPESASAAAVADQIAALRDHLSTELEAVRAAVAQAPAAVEAARAPSEEEERYAAIDPDTVDLLREEIRGAGGVSDQVVEALREELKALRRRLAVKAQEKVLSDEQLRLIADAVAERISDAEGG